MLASGKPMATGGGARLIVTLSPEPDEGSKGRQSLQIPYIYQVDYTVYILKCSDGSYYVGVTNDIERRLEEHQSGTNKEAYTHNRRPVELVFAEHFQYINDAIAFEKQVKGWRREKKEALINGEWDKLPELSRRYGDNGMSSSRASD